MAKPLTKANREFLVKISSAFKEFRYQVIQMFKWILVALRRDWQRNPVLLGLTPTFSPIVLAVVLTWQDKLSILAKFPSSFSSIEVWILTIGVFLVGMCITTLGNRSLGYRYLPCSISLALFRSLVFIFVLIIVGLLITESQVQLIGIVTILYFLQTTIFSLAALRVPEEPLYPFQLMKSPSIPITVISTHLSPIPRAEEDDLKSLINKKRISRLVGSSGTGKTTLLKMVGWNLKEKGWQIFYVDFAYFVTTFPLNEAIRWLRSIDNPFTLLLLDNAHLDYEISEQMCNILHEETAFLRALFAERMIPTFYKSRLPSQGQCLEFPLSMKLEITETLVKDVLSQITSFTNVLSKEIQHFIRESGSNLYVVQLLAEHWRDRQVLPKLNQIRKLARARIVEPLRRDPILGLEAIIALYACACLYEYEIPMARAFLTRYLQIPYGIIDNLVQRGELEALNSSLTFSHPSRARLLRLSIEEDEGYIQAIEEKVKSGNSAPRVAVWISVGEEYPSSFISLLVHATLFEEPDHPMMLKLLADPKCPEVFAEGAREADFWYLGVALYGLVVPILETEGKVELKGGNNHLIALSKVVEESTPILKDRLLKASLADILNFLMFPAIYNIFHPMLAEILRGVPSELYVEKALKAEIWDIGFAVWELSWPTLDLEETAKEILTKTQDRILAKVKVANEEDIYKIGVLVHNVGHVDAAFASRILSVIRTPLREKAGQEFVKHLLEGLSLEDTIDHDFLSKTLDITHSILWDAGLTRLANKFKDVTNRFLIEGLPPRDLAKQLRKALLHLHLRPEGAGDQAN